MSKPFAETSQDRKDRLAKIRTEWDKIGAVPDQPPALPTEAASPDDADDEPQGDGRTVTSDELEDEVRTTLLYGKIGRASCRKECRSRWSPYH